MIPERAFSIKTLVLRKSMILKKEFSFSILSQEHSLFSIQISLTKENNNEKMKIVPTFKEAPWLQASVSQMLHDTFGSIAFIASRASGNISAFICCPMIFCEHISGSFVSQ